MHRVIIKHAHCFLCFFSSPVFTKSLVVAAKHFVFHLHWLPVSFTICSSIFCNLIVCVFLARQWAEVCVCHLLPSKHCVFVFPWELHLAASVWEKKWPHATMVDNMIFVVWWHCQHFPMLTAAKWPSASNSGHCRDNKGMYECGLTFWWCATSQISVPVRY